MYRVWVNYKDGRRKEMSGLTYRAGLALKMDWGGLAPWKDTGVSLIGALNAV